MQLTCGRVTSLYRESIDNHYADDFIWTRSLFNSDSKYFFSDWVYLTLYESPMFHYDVCLSKSRRVKLYSSHIEQQRDSYASVVLSAKMK